MSRSQRLSAPSRFAPFAERIAYGQKLRDVVRRVDQNVWKVPRRRRGVIDALRASEEGRVATLLPIKYGRMAASPFAFFRGSAAIMAGDLASLPRTGYHVQICGDAHVRNLGAYASPDGRIVFDINDFDETWRAPWEWDLKRLAASFVLAGREAKCSDRSCRDAALMLVQSYRRALAYFAPLPAVELARYQVNRHLDEGPVHEVLRKAERAGPRTSLKKLTVPARAGRRRFAQRPPLLVRVDERTRARVLGALQEYRATLGPNRQLVLDAYCPVDVAFKVVGTGSVGTRDYVVLCFGNGPSDPLILQVKEAAASSYARYVPAERGVTTHQGRRVAEGQHRMQTVADPFLGWTTIAGADYLVRQLADHKASIEPEDLGNTSLVDYAVVCGEIFAKAHARTGDGAVLHGYAGNAAKLDIAIADFAVQYADQATSDYESFLKAIKDGRLVARKLR
jgi:uncharacterized protein (DUF2252 family)